MLLITAHPEFLEAALQELKARDKRLTTVQIITPDIALCSVPEPQKLMHIAAEQHPVFVRHLAPVQAVIDLTNTEQDIGRFALAIADLPDFRQLERGQHFAVQTRIVQTDNNAGKKPYSSGLLNRELAEAIIEETGAIEAIKKPDIVISLLCTTDKGYIGISTARENISSWPGGARHFAHTSEQISRAEFKLLEALDVFGITLPERGEALDLGAAPGGWTRLLLEAGLQVIAVDPANLDPRLQRYSGLKQYRGYAENYLEEALKKRKKFDIIVNDMRMDAREAARLLASFSSCLAHEALVISTLKLPHATHTVKPLANMREAINILNRAYATVQARQLFHNRQEVTVVAAHPISQRR